MDALRALLQRPEPVRWVFAGDSITHGAAHTIGWRDYTELFSERVRWELRRTRDMVIKTGISGWTVADLAADLDWNVLQFRPHCVSLMFGMNDCTRGPGNLAAFRATYLEIIARIRDETGAAILLHTPNWTLSAGGEARVANLPAYREAVLEVASVAQVPCLDHFAEWAAAEQTGAMDHWLAHGCHPNEYGHRAFAFALFRALEIWDATSWTCQLMVPR
ncbi:MAG: GDSL-type esterase/lipase family protein [Thermomicrobiales bacterium]